MGQAAFMSSSQNVARYIEERRNPIGIPACTIIIPDNLDLQTPRCMIAEPKPPRETTFTPHNYFSISFSFGFSLFFILITLMYVQYIHTVHNFQLD